MRRFLTPRVTEALIAIAVFASSALWGSWYWGASLKAGRQPSFYQTYFEPAVMIACGHGFVISHPQPKPLEDFLLQREQTFSCDQIAGHLDLSTQYLYQGAWRYLLYATGITWYFTGIAWSRLAALAGVMFGFSILSIYGIFRLGMGRRVSLGGAFLLAISTLHLTNLPHLRDYSKAPFTLAAILILGWIVKAKPSRRAVVLLSAAYGLVLGVGYGFRTDLLIEIPPILIVLFLFLDGGFTKHIVTKIAGVVAFSAVFFVTAWPILSFVYDKGGAQWHVILLGFAPGSNELLEPTPYELVGASQDLYVDKTVRGYGSRVHPAWRDVIYGTHEYDVSSGSYLKEIVTRFPADLMIRALASTTQLTDLATGWPMAPMDGLARWMYRLRYVLLRVLRHTGPIFVLLAAAAIAAYDLRLGLYVTFFLLYFGGYPAIQFGTRHLFHFEFIGVWAAAFVIAGAITRPPGWSARRAAVWAGVSALVVVVPLAGLRLYQTRQAKTLFGSYVEGPRTAIRLGEPDRAALVHIAGPTDFRDVKFLELDLHPASCGPHVAIRYQPTPPDNDYSDTLDIPSSNSSEPTRIFAPIYSSTFQGIELPGARRGCVAAAYWVDPDHRPLLLTFVMPPDWTRRPLYQRVGLKLVERKP